MKKSRFFKWLATQQNRNDPIGDLARDANDDVNVFGLDSLDAWLDYLARVQADYAAVRTAREAWQEFDLLL
ncbi:YozE family protein [Burkholderia orbicola]|uniref:YozE family protein n=1 Tax=Burkholderia orbicola TaxID=2978683 RepID=UPI002FE198D9